MNKVPKGQETQGQDRIGLLGRESSREKPNQAKVLGLHTQSQIWVVSC